MKTIVAINPWVEHRNPAVFGNDADEFRPDRWLTEDADKLAIMNRHWMPVSSSIDMALPGYESQALKIDPFSLVRTGYADLYWTTHRDAGDI